MAVPCPMWELLLVYAERSHRQGSAISRDLAHRVLRQFAAFHLDPQHLPLIRRLHCLLVFSGLSSLDILCNHLIRLYAASSSLLEAACAFHAVRQPSAYTWSSIISAHGDHGACSTAFRLYSQALFQGFGANKCMCLAALKASVAPTATLDYVMLIHNAIVEDSDLLSDVMIGNALIHVYTKCGNGSVEDACGVFSALPYRTRVSWNAMVTAYAQFGEMDLAMICFQDMRRDGIIPNVISWGTIIAGYAQSGHDFIALDCYKIMHEEEVKPDRVIFSSTLKACGSGGHLKEGRLIHFQIAYMNVCFETELGTALVDMYSKCGSLEDATTVLMSCRPREVAPWNALISGHVECGDVDMALLALEDMQKDGINPDVVTWTTVIGGFIQNGNGFLAMHCFQRMQEAHVLPNTHTYSNLLKACGMAGALGNGMVVHDRLERDEIEDLVVKNAVVNMYAQCGSTNEAHTLLTKLPYRNVVSWSALITGYSYHGNAKLALKCFHDMLDDGVQPNEVAFACILTACSHAGLVDEGYRYLNIMKDGHNIMPNIHHRICMVDLLARAGRLQEAEEMLSAAGLNPDGWRSLLTAGRTFGNFDLGRQWFEQVCLLDHLNDS